MKNKYIKIIVLLLIFSFIITDTKFTLYKKYILFAEESTGIKDSENKTTEVENKDNTGGDVPDKKEEEKPEKITNGFFDISGRVNWNYSEGKLIFTGNGAIPDFGIEHNNLPWRSYSIEITEIEISDGITDIGSYTFDGCTSLVKVNAAASLKRISTSSFPRKNDITFFAPSGSYVAAFAGENGYKFSSTSVEKYTVYFRTYTNETFSPITVVAGDSYGELPVPSLEGYNFLGWYTAKTGGVKITSSSKADIKSDIYLHAQWEKKQNNQYKVNFRTLTDVTLDPKTVTFGDSYGALPTPLRTGYKFLGWYTNYTGGTNITSSSTVDIKSDITLYARWEKKKYKVTFNTLTSESFAPITVAYGDYFSKLPEPSAKGYKFLGWYTDTVAGINIKLYSKVELESDIILYARWEKKQYKVEFRDSYSDSSLIEKTISEGDEFGSLPEPVREGYNFLGWFAYTDQSKEYKVTAATKFYSSYTSQTSIRLYAKWERAKYVVTFDPAGGIIRGVGGVNIKTLLYGYYYGNLPMPEREGYEFKGWFTEAENGEQIFSYTTVPALTAPYQTLYAHWEKIIVEEHIVSFNPNGGSLNKEEIRKTVVFGKEYGVLPVPSRKGYSFTGWFTKKKGGKKIYGNDIFKNHSDIILYARWTKYSKIIYKAKLLKNLSYNFENSHDGFNYQYGYKIPLKIFQFMFGKTDFANLLYKYDGYWGGNCYGMSATSGMFCTNTVIKPSAFKKGAKLPSDLKLSNKNKRRNMSLRSFIEVMQISQYYSSVQNAYNKNAGKLNDIVKEVRKFQKSGKNPIIIAISGSGGAHAVVGYAVEDYTNGTSRLFVYDPNFPNAKRYIALRRSSGGNYTGWYYLMSNTYNWGSSYDGVITYVRSREYTNIWKTHDNLKIASNMLFTDTDNAVIYDENKNVAAVLNNGKLISKNKEIKKLWDFKLHKDNNIKISLPAGVYTVENTGKKKNFVVAMAGAKMGTEVTASSDKVIIGVDEARNICMAKALIEGDSLVQFAFIKNGGETISVN